MANYRFKPALTEVKMIRKKGLSEREFYHRIMEAIYKLGDDDMLTDEEARMFQEALRAQGCMTYKEYVEKEVAKGNPEPPKRVSYSEIANGDIYAAAIIIDQLLLDPKNCKIVISRMNEGHGFSPQYQWLQASRQRLNMSEYYKRKMEDLEAYRRLPTDDDGEPSR